MVINKNAIGSCCCDDAAGCGACAATLDLVLPAHVLAGFGVPPAGCGCTALNGTITLSGVPTFTLDPPGAIPTRVCIYEGRVDIGGDVDACFGGGYPGGLIYSLYWSRDGTIRDADIIAGDQPELWVYDYAPQGGGGELYGSRYSQLWAGRLNNITYNNDHWVEDIAVNGACDADLVMTYFNALGQDHVVTNNGAGQSCVINAGSSFTVQP